MNKQQFHHPREVVFEPVADEFGVPVKEEPYREIMCGCTEELIFTWESHVGLAERIGLNAWEDII